MKRKATTLTLLALIALAAAPGLPARAAAPGAALVAVSALEKSAKARVGTTARVPLTGVTVDAGELAPAGETPNYAKGLGRIPGSPEAFVALVRAVLFQGRLAPEVKLAMGLRVAQVHDSAYVGAHMARWLGRTDRGKAALAALRAGDESSLPPADALAVRYAELLSRDVHGITDAEFARVRAHYDDSEIVELTTTTCFLNYFTRMAEGLALPVEPWALEAAAPVAAASREDEKYVPRVGLISDAEIAGASELAAQATTPANKTMMLGLGIPNSMRAMMRAPEAARAWRAYGLTGRDKAVVERSTLLQVSFAVSTANGCRYCIIHQVLGLRKLGVDVGKLVEMQKDDKALTPRELAAVTFARKLTAAPTSTTAADYQALEKEFGDRGALEVLLQTCTFAFMNRFTDNMNLPSEDEAVQVYREVYGPSAY